MKALITVGSDEGDWAPPQTVELVVTTKTGSGLGITNANQVRWPVEGHGRIICAAISLGSDDWSTCEWARVDLEGVTPVEPGQNILLAPGVLAIDVELPTLTLPEQRLIRGSPALLRGLMR